MRLGLESVEISVDGHRAGCEHELASAGAHSLFDLAGQAHATYAVESDASGTVL
jgi:hypothetical protein